MDQASKADGHDESTGPVQATVNGALRHARRLVVAVVGGTVLGIGVVMLVTPGPAVVFIPLGLAILAIEFAWARRLLKRVREQFPDRAGKGPAETEASKDRADAARRQPGQDHETQESSASRAPTRS